MMKDVCTDLKKENAARPLDGFHHYVLIMSTTGRSQEGEART
jgi:hypothetical protein